MNSYDDTVLETDFVLPQTLDVLTASDRMLPTMILIGGQGGSLRGDGSYLLRAKAGASFSRNKRCDNVPGLEDVSSIARAARSDHPAHGPTAGQNR